MRDSFPDVKKPKGFDPSGYQPDEINLFGPMSFEPEDLAGYLRTGGCTANCGACCTEFVIPITCEGRDDDGFQDVESGRLHVPVDPIVIGKPGYDDWEMWLGLHDVTVLQLSSGLLVADLPIKCEAPPGIMTGDSWFTWLEAQGVTLIRRGPQQVFAYITRACDELADNGGCEVFGTSRRPKLCGDYPRHPSDIQGLESFCTYRFTPVSQVELAARNLARNATSQRPSRKKKSHRKGKKNGRR